MGMIISGGQIRTRRVAVGTTATLLTNSPAGVPYRGGLVIQQSDIVDVFLGGPDVSATADATRGYLLPATPNTTPATPPAELAEAVTNQAWYGVVAAGTGHVVVLEFN